MDHLHCKSCGAQQTRKVDCCWLCGREMAEAYGHRPYVEKFSFSLSTLLLITTLASIAFGLLAVAPGLGVFVCIIILPVFVRTLLVLRKREAKGMDVSPRTKTILFWGSFFSASLIAILVSITAFGAFCVSLCFLAPRSGGGIYFVYIFTTLATLSVITIAFFWVRDRYERDTRRD